MWICLNDAFLSIVDKECGPDELLVRARRPGDIERIFPRAKVKKSTTTDYLFRAVVPRTDVAEALMVQVMAIDYGNFKDSVKDRRLHDAFARIWSIMAALQPTAPYSGRRQRGSLF
jgi:hypothetical protein